MPYAANANRLVVRGALRAFDASDVSKGELWDSEDTGNENDRLGQFAKFCPPTVANGKVYVATFQQENVTEEGTHVKTRGGDEAALVIYGIR
jgi:outer membrane protein assembly factor BamB